MSVQSALRVNTLILCVAPSLKQPLHKQKQKPQICWLQRRSNQTQSMSKMLPCRLPLSPRYAFIFPESVVNIPVHDRLWARNTPESPPLPSISSSTMHQRRRIKPSKRESTASRLRRRWVRATWIKQRHLPLRPSRRCKYVMQIGACWIVVDDVDIRNIFLPLLVASTRILLRLEGCQEDMSALQRKLTRKKTSVPREPRRHRPQVFLPQTRLRRATPTRVPTL